MCETAREAPGVAAGDEQAQLARLEAQLDALKSRWPRHSVPPVLWQELEELEEKLRRLRAG